MPGCSGGPVVTNARVYYTSRAAAGATAPGMPHALNGAENSAQLGRITPRDREDVSSRHCEERKRRSNPAFCLAAPKLDCFAALAMTGGCRRGCLKIELRCKCKLAKKERGSNLRGCPSTARAFPGMGPTRSSARGVAKIR